MGKFNKQEKAQTTKIWHDEYFYCGIADDLGWLFGVLGK